MSYAAAAAGPRHETFTALKASDRITNVKESPIYKCSTDGDMVTLVQQIMTV
jgi:hypothetical protein